MLKISLGGDISTGNQFTETKYFGGTPNPGKGIGIRTTEDSLFINTYKEAGVNKVLSMPTKTITTFGGKNPEVIFDMGMSNKAYLSKGGGVSNEITEGLSSFKSGTAKPIYGYKEEVYGGKIGFEYSPTGKYNINTKIKGVEFTNIIGKGNEEGLGFTQFTGGGTKTPFSKTFGISESQATTQFQIPKSPKLPSFTSSPGEGLTLTPQSLVPKTSQSLFPLISSQEIKSNTRTSSLQFPSFSLTTKENQLNKVGQGVLTLSRFNELSLTKTNSAFSFNQPSSSKLASPSASSLITSTGFNYSPFSSSISTPNEYPSLTGGFGMPELGGYIINVPRTRGKKSKEVSIAPSFTGIVQNIKMTNSLKVSKEFGVTPFQTRGLLVNKKGKRSNKPYFEIIDF